MHYTRTTGSDIKRFARAAVLAVTLFSAVSAATSAHAFCFEEAGKEYGINPQILRAIAKVESNFNPAAVNVNTNGSYDFGLMQVNSIWAATLGKERWQAQGDACYNTKTGAWILSMCMNKYGYTWKAIGCYNSQTPSKSAVYSQRVFKQLQKVHPVAQEAAYAPIKDKLEGVVKNKVDGWVEQTATNGKAGEFVVKENRAYVPVPKEVLQQPPALREVKVQRAHSTPDPTLASAAGGNADVGLQ